MSTEKNVLTAPSPATATRSATILIVDDEDGVRRLLTHWINSLGYTAKAVGDADSALEVMKASPVDVAVCDIRMPGHDGVWLIDQVRKDFPGTAVVIATGLPDIAPTIAMQTGVAGYLIKPFERQDLATVLSNALTPDKPWVRHVGHPGAGLNGLPEI